MGLEEKIMKPILDKAKRFLVDTLTGTPSKDTIIIVQDAHAAETAAGNIALYLDERGEAVCLMKPQTYHKLRHELINNRVIIIGHHDLAKEHLGNVNIQEPDPMCSAYGLICGTSYRKCVLRASRKALGRKKGAKAAFALYYEDKMSGYAAFAEKYGIPRVYGKRAETRESQYDLLWTIFVNDVLPSLGWEREPSSRGAAEQERAPGAGSEGHPEPPEDVSEQLLEQFLREAPSASRLTPDYLRHFYERQLKFAPPSFVLGEEGGQRTLLERGRWRVWQDLARGSFCVQECGGSYCVRGTAERILSPMLSDIHAQAQARRLREAGRLDYGIVFCGGGAKGAFQLGVWRWLREHGGTERFTGVSGASVGAMNALLFAGGDYQRAEAVWLNMRQEDLIRWNTRLAKNLDALLPESETRPDLLEIAETLLGDFQGNAGLFSKEKLERVIRENISLEGLREKLAYVSISALRAPEHMKIEGLSSVFSPEYAFLDAWNPNPLEYSIRRVLASAALPGAYTPETVDGKLCIDGGVLDNSPSKPLLQAGYRKLLVVHLSPAGPDAADGRAADEASPAGQSGPRIWHVRPSASLGGTLEIDPGLTRRRIDAGYAAASACLGDFC